MKKKAPCGKIDRDDLPWCCHRRLGEWLPRLSATQGGRSARMLLNSECQPSKASLENFHSFSDIFVDDCLPSSDRQQQ